MDSMYEQLMVLPLFKGVSRDRISEIVGQNKFHFIKYPEQTTIIKAGERCTHITFLISGSVRSVISSRDGRFSVGQTLKAPDVFTPEYLFGRSTNYPCTVSTLETTGLLKISKEDYMNILHTDEVFMFNFLNIISRNAQKSIDGILALTDGTMEERIAFWIACLSQPSGQDIRLICRHRDLTTLFGVTRQSLKAALDGLKERGMIDYTPNEIFVLNRRELITLLTSHI